MTGPARLRISAGPGRAVTAQDFCGPGRYGPRFTTRVATMLIIFCLITIKTISINYRVLIIKLTCFWNLKGVRDFREFTRVTFIRVQLHQGLYHSIELEGLLFNRICYKGKTL